MISSMKNHHAGFFISSPRPNTMKSSIYFFSFLLIMFSVSIFAQNYDQDALQYSQMGVGGTSRIQGLAGTNIALGADMSSLSGNPAGLGFFRKSEWSITGGLGLNNTNTTFLGESGRDNKLGFNVPNFGVVWSAAKDDLQGGSWRGGSFGISFNRTSNFTNQFSYQGINNRTSFLDFLANEASEANRGNGIDPRDLSGEFQVAPNGVDYELVSRSGAAYFAYLINPVIEFNPETEKDENTNKYYRFNDGSDILVNPFSKVRQAATVTTRGANNQWNFSYGGNIDDKIYFGASLGINRIRNVVSNKYREDFQLPENIRYINSFTYEEEKTITGTGFSIKGGVIYKPNDFIRIGFTAVSPTAYTGIRETSVYSFTANYPSDLIVETYDYETETVEDKFPYEGTDGLRISTVPNDFKYVLTAPAQFSGGIALFAGKAGFVSADVDYILYNTIQVRASDANTGDLSFFNDAIKRNFQNAFNARIGGELRLDIFRIRGGFGYQQDAMLNNNVDDTRFHFSLGAGVRTRNNYFDVAIVHSRFQSAFTPYTIYEKEDRDGFLLSNTPQPEYVNVSPSALIKNTPTVITFTFGSYF
jgi:hypothetical protein